MKINLKDIDAVTAAIVRAEGRATARTVNYATATNLATWAEKELKSILPQSMWSGTVAHYLPPRMPNSYNYRAEGTFLSITRGSNSWFLTSVSRGNCGSCSYGGSARLKMELSEKQQFYFVETHPLLDKVVATSKAERIMQAI